jgi:hypothetical protein
MAIEPGEPRRLAELADAIARRVTPGAEPLEVDAVGPLAGAALRCTEAGVVAVIPSGATGALAAWVALGAAGLARIIVIGEAARLDRLAAALAVYGVAVEVASGGGIVPAEPWRPTERGPVGHEDPFVTRILEELAPIAAVVVASYPDGILVEYEGVPIAGRWCDEPVVGVDSRDWAMRREQRLGEDELVAEAITLLGQLVEPPRGRTAWRASSSRWTGRRLRERWLASVGAPIEPDGAGRGGERAYARGADGTLWGFGRAEDPWLAVEARALAGSEQARIVVEGRLGAARRVVEAFGPIEVIEESG